MLYSVLRLRSPTFLLPTTLSCTLRYPNNKFYYMHTLHSCRHSCTHVHLPYRCTCLLFSPQTHNVCTILFTVLFSLFFWSSSYQPHLVTASIFFFLYSPLQHAYITRTLLEVKNRPNSFAPAPIRVHCPPSLL